MLRAKGIAECITDSEDNCGTCWSLSYGGGAPIYVMAIDKSGSGFITSQTALNQLDPNNNNVAIPVTAQSVDQSYCLNRL